MTPWPFGELRIGQEAIEVRSMARHYTMPREDIQSVEPASAKLSGIYPWFGFGIRIRHACEGCPQLQMFLPFWFWRRAPILSYARLLGYKVP